MVANLPLPEQFQVEVDLEFRWERLHLIKNYSAGNLVSVR